jgi:hypothetical protein
MVSMGMLEAAVEDLKKEGYTEEEITNAFMTLIKSARNKSTPVGNIDEVFGDE